jgi:hypothetical protein
MKATRINAKQAQGLINNENESFNDQPAITNNGDSKETKKRLNYYQICKYNE